MTLSVTLPCELKASRVRGLKTAPSLLPASGRVVMIVRFDPAGAATTTAYDAAGRVTTQIDRDGRVIQYTYDATNELGATSSNKKIIPRSGLAHRKAVSQKPSTPSPKKGLTRLRRSRKGATKAVGNTFTQAPYSFPPPVSPRPEQLPLSDRNWAWEAFQAFCLEMVSRLPTTKEAGKNHHLGKQGDAQDGIDLFADMNNGEHWGFQRKKVKRFTEARHAESNQGHDLQGGQVRHSPQHRGDCSRPQGRAEEKEVGRLGRPRHLPSGSETAT
jgi:YD repeat-containing protein